MHRFVRDLVAPRAWQPVLPPERDVEPDPVVNPALRAARSWLTRLQERLTKMKYVRGYMNEEINFGGSVGGPGPPGIRPGQAGPPERECSGKHPSAGWVCWAADALSLMACCPLHAGHGASLIGVTSLCLQDRWERYFPSVPGTGILRGEDIVLVHTARGRGSSGCLGRAHPTRTSQTPSAGFQKEEPPGRRSPPSPLAQHRLGARQGGGQRDPWSHAHLAVIWAFRPSASVIEATGNFIEVLLSPPVTWAASPSPFVGPLAHGQ